MNTLDLSSTRGDPLKLVQSMQHAISNPSLYDNLIISGMDLECDIASSLSSLLRRRTNPWDKVEIKKCLGPIHGLISCLLEETDARINSLVLHSTLEERGVAKALNKGLAKNRVKQLIVFNSTLISQELMEAFTSGISENNTMTSLESICFSKCSFQHSGIVEFGNSLSKGFSRIKELSIVFSNLSDDESAWIASSCKHIKNLVSLDLQGNHCQDKTIQALGELLLESNCQLKCLNLGFLKSKELHDMDLLFKNASSLRELNFQSVTLNDRCSKRLAQFLSRPSTRLETLVLTDCHLSKSSFGLLLQNLTKSPCLKEVRMDGHQSIGLYHRKEWTHMTTTSLQQQNNVTLQALYLPNCFDRYRINLNYLLDMNFGGGRKLVLLDHDKMSSSLWPTILQRIHAVCLPYSSCTTTNTTNRDETVLRRVNMMYFMLRQRLLLETYRNTSIST